MLGWILQIRSTPQGLSRSPIHKEVITEDLHAEGTYDLLMWREFRIPQSTVTKEQIKALTGHSSGAIACNVSLTWSWAMTQRDDDDLWRDFPKTATGFEARFATEEDCRAYWIEARSGGKPACARYGSTLVRPDREPLGPFVQMDEALKADR